MRWRLLAAVWLVAWAATGCTNIGLFVGSEPRPPTGRAGITPGGIVNVASYSPRGLPTSAIAQGSIFAVFGEQLAEPGLRVADAFPLPLELGGVSARVTVDGTTLDCSMIFSTPSQLAILLPSATPVGLGQLTLSFEGREFSEPIEVTDHGPGVFAQNSQGSGPASFQNFVSEQEQPLNGIASAIQNGDVGTLWMTGLGAVPGDEAAGPLPGNMAGLDVKVYVNGVESPEILYAGRSSCCAGIDQLIFRVPEGVEGCWLPLVVTVDGVPSNHTVITVTPDGPLCLDPGRVQSFLGRDTARLGILAPSALLNDTLAGAVGGFPGQFSNLRIETASALFAGLDLTTFPAPPPPEEFFPSNSCHAYTFSGGGLNVAGFLEVEGLDVGALTIAGPGGVREAPAAEPGNHSLDISGLALPGLPGIPGLQSTPFLTPGEFTFAATGGADVGAFSITRSLTSGVEWTNKRAVRVIDRGEALAIEWSGGDPDEESVFVYGLSFLGVAEGPPAQAVQIITGAAFYCQADADLGEFSVPVEVLSALPESSTAPFGQFGSVPTSFLVVGAVGTPLAFEAEGLDFGFFTYYLADSAFVVVR